MNGPLRKLAPKYSPCSSMSWATSCSQPSSRSALRLNERGIGRIDYIGSWIISLFMSFGFALKKESISPDCWLLLTPMSFLCSGSELYYSSTLADECCTATGCFYNCYLLDLPEFKQPAVDYETSWKLGLSGFPLIKLAPKSSLVSGRRDLEIVRVLVDVGICKLCCLVFLCVSMESIINI